MGSSGLEREKKERLMEAREAVKTSALRAQLWGPGRLVIESETEQLLGMSAAHRGDAQPPNRLI